MTIKYHVDVWRFITENAVKIIDIKNTDVNQKTMQTQISRPQHTTEQDLKALKSRFINRVSQDFQAPLSIILLSTELLTHHSHSWDAETKLQHLHRIQAAVMQMTQLLEESLNQTLQDD